MPKLRQIAVHVEEPTPAAFAWVLTERHGDRWPELDRAASTASTYRAAMAAGLLALQGRVEDLDAGPRVVTGDAPADEKPAAPARPYFGFGPAR